MTMTYTDNLTEALSDAYLEWRMQQAAANDADTERQLARAAAYIATIRDSTHSRSI